MMFLLLVLVCVVGLVMSLTELALLILYGRPPITTDDWMRASGVQDIYEAEMRRLTERP